MIDISKLDYKILEIFAPLLLEMEQLNQILDFKEFFEGADKLFSVDKKNH